MWYEQKSGLPHFDILCDLLLNTDAQQHEIYLFCAV